MALGDNNGSIKYLHIKNGKISYKKNKEDSEYSQCGFVEGIITGVKFEDKEYQGKKYIQAGITIVDGDEKYLLQMDINSGYFISFCNSMRSGDLTKRVKISPWLTEKDNKKKSGIFVEQNGSSLKWFSTKENPNGVPPLEAVEFEGQKKWSNYKQRMFWKGWLEKATFGSEFEASSMSQPPVTGSPAKTNVQDSIQSSNKIDESEDFLKSLDLDEDPF